MPCPICKAVSPAEPVRIEVPREKGRDRLLVRCEPCDVVYVRDYEVPSYETFRLEHFKFDETGPRFDGFGYHLGLVHRHVLPPGRWLDVGASAGFAVRNARSSGWDAAGMEPAAELADWGARHFQVPLETTLPAEREAFDVITSSEVIEHVPDPVGWLERLYALQAPGGLLFLTTPNADSTPGRTNPAGWPQMRNRLHAVLFGPAGLDRLLARVGWRPVEGFAACGDADDEMLHVIARKSGAARVREVPDAWRAALGARDPRRSIALHEFVGLGGSAAERPDTGQRLDRLEARLLTLEREASSPTLEAESLTIKDPAGRPRAILSADLDGSSEMVWFDTAGEARCRVGVDREGAPLVALADGGGRARLGIVLDEAGRPSVGVYDGSGRVLGLLASDEDGTPRWAAVSDDTVQEAAPGAPQEFAPEV